MSTVRRTKNTKTHMFRNGQMMPKADIFRWSIDDVLGESLAISKHDLNVDYTYQRSLVPSKVKAIRERFSHAAFGTLLVSRRNDGTFWIVDGSHRHAASMYIETMLELPCRVFNFNSLEDEAFAFLTTNGLRKPVTATEKFKAMLVSGDPTAVFVQSLINQDGYSVSNDLKGRTIRCPRCFMDLAKRNSEVMTRIWPLLIEIHQGRSILERITEPVFYIEERMEDDSLTHAKWRKRLVALGVDGIAAAIARSQAMYMRGGPKVWARGLVATLNKGLTERGRLKIAGITDEHGE